VVVYAMYCTVHIHYSAGLFNWSSRYHRPSFDHAAYHLSTYEGTSGGT
jgi:hypothetical protein